MKENMQIVDLTQPIKNVRRGQPPLVVNVSTVSNIQYTETGPIEGPEKVESYVLFSALPEELQRRVQQAIHMIRSSI